MGIGRSEEISKYTAQKGQIKKKIRESEKVLKRVKIWEEEFELNNYEYRKVKFIKYEEELSKGEQQTIYVLTTLLNQDLKTILKIMHVR